MLGRRSEQLVEGERVRIVGGEHGSEDRHQHEQRQDRRAAERLAVGKQALPDTGDDPGPRLDRLDELLAGDDRNSHSYPASRVRGSRIAVRTSAMSTATSTATVIIRNSACIRAKSSLSTACRSMKPSPG